LLPDTNVDPSHVIVVPLTLLVIVVQFTPPFTDPSSTSPLVNAADNVPLIVCDAVFVIKSLLLVPVSELRLTPLTVSVDACVSNVKLGVTPAPPSLPAASV
jgi:hypothetical protein